MVMRMSLPDAEARKAMLATGMEHGMEASYERLETMLGRYARADRPGCGSILGVAGVGVGVAVLWHPLRAPRDALNETPSASSDLRALCRAIGGDGKLDRIACRAPLRDHDHPIAELDQTFRPGFRIVLDGNAAWDGNVKRIALSPALGSYGRLADGLALRLALLGEEIEQRADRWQEAPVRGKHGMHDAGGRRPVRQHVHQPASLSVLEDQERRQ